MPSALGNNVPPSSRLPQLYERTDIYITYMPCEDPGLGKVRGARFVSLPVPPRSQRQFLFHHTLSSTATYGSCAILAVGALSSSSCPRGSIRLEQGVLATPITCHVPFGHPYSYNEQYLFGRTRAISKILVTENMAGFDPYLQPVRFLASDGKTPIAIPISDIDRFNEESVSICLNYGAQFGACIVMLLVFLVSTPSSKFRGPSTILYIIALVICVIRMALLGAFFPSPLNEFYNYWAVDYSAVPIHHFRVSVAGNVSSLLLVVAIEAALVNQAWVMLSLWPSVAKYIFSSISFSVTLLTIGWRMVYTILLSKAVFSAESARPIRWVSKWAIITNTVSICWFCALFNVKLVVHLIAHRGVLPPCRTLTPIEVLIMTNGILMVVPGWFPRLDLFRPHSLSLSGVQIQGR